MNPSPLDPKLVPELKRYFEWSRFQQKERFPFRWTAILCGQRLTLKYKSDKEPHKRGGKRGGVGPFSKQARFRMLKMIATIDWRNVGPSMMITLTYPDSIAHTDKERRNRERYLFIRNLERYLCRHVCGLWRVEYQPRKSGSRKGETLAHMHVFLFGVKFVPYDELRRWWQQAIGSEELPMVNVMKAKNGIGAVRYIAKYCGKVADMTVNLDKVTYLNSGRHYGYHRRHHIPLHLELAFPLLDPALVHRVRVLAGQHLRYLDLDYFETFTLIGEFAVKIGEMLVEKTFDTGEGQG